MIGYLNPLFTLLLSPLLFGIINRTKALFAGRKGPPLLQPYYDLVKLFQKGVVISTTTTPLLKLSPLVAVAVPLIASLLVPFGGLSAPLSFAGDILFIAALLAIIRFFSITAALDTGFSLEGIGASREACFSALAEPTFLIALVALAKRFSSFSLSSIYSFLCFDSLRMAGSIPLILCIAALFIVFLLETSRIPFDDPATHLELTMTHEVMILDHSGVDLGLLQLGSMMKMWLFGSLIVGLFLPLRIGPVILEYIFAFVGMFLLALLVGFIESMMARLRLPKIPELMMAALILATLALIIA